MSAVGDCMVKQPTIYAPHLSLKTGIPPDDARDLYDRLTRVFEPLVFHALTLRILGRDTNGTEWSDVGSLIFS